ncbi:MAG: ParB/RepB/Spo0J family partition protein [Bacilli bacterium]
MSKRLGRGLDALIPSLSASESEAVTEIEIKQLRPNPYQPRKHFEHSRIEELAQSIKEHGLIQPIIVRKVLRGYEIVAGERRYRAAQMAKLEHIPAVVREMTEQQVMEVAIIENLQREDLNVMEVAEAYQKLMIEFHLTQEELALKVGKSRPHVANFLRLLQLPHIIQEYVSRGTLSMGHARAILGIKDNQHMMAIAKRAIEEEWSVRELEEWIQRINERVPRETKKKSDSTNQYVRNIEEKLQSTYGTLVKIKQGKSKGKIEIEYTTQEDLERIVALLG